MTEGRAVALAVKPKQCRADANSSEQQNKDQTDE
jgi:hypothetical protein